MRAYAGDLDHRTFRREARGAARIFERLRDRAAGEYTKRLAGRTANAGPGADAAVSSADNPGSGANGADLTAEPDRLHNAPGQ